MNFTLATTLFLTQLSFGCLAALALLRREQIGRGFSRFMAGVVAVAATLALMLTLAPSAAGTSVVSGEQRFMIIAVCVAAALYIFASGAARARVETPVLLLALVLAGVALFEVTRTTMSDVRPHPLTMLSSFGSACVLGGVGGAMVLGHWYLVVPGLSLDHLARLNRASLVALYIRAGLLVLTLSLFTDRWWQRDLQGFRAAYDLLGLGTRVLVGLVAPIVLAHLTAVTVRLKATQPATGILYASTVLVLMGELMALVVTDSLKLPV
jgi:hypothetical protein